MEHNHGGLDDHFPLSMGHGCRFQPLIFQGVIQFWSSLMKSSISRFSRLALWEQQCMPVRGVGIVELEYNIRADEVRNSTGITDNPCRCWSPRSEFG